MKKYNVEVTEILQKTITVEASSEEEALKIVQAKYNEEEIILDDSNLITSNFNILK